MGVPKTQPVCDLLNRKIRVAQIEFCRAHFIVNIIFIRRNPVSLAKDTYDMVFGIAVFCAKQIQRKMFARKRMNICADLFANVCAFILHRTFYGNDHFVQNNGSSVAHGGIIIRIVISNLL